jgi:hypothetical protein
MKDWIKRALTKKIQQRATETIDIPPNEKLVYGVKFTIATTLILSTLEIAHIIFLGKWNSEIFAAITALTGTITGILITQKT